MEILPAGAWSLRHYCTEGYSCHQLPLLSRDIRTGTFIWGSILQPRRAALGAREGRGTDRLRLRTATTMKQNEYRQVPELTVNIFIRANPKWGAEKERESLSNSADTGRAFNKPLPGKPSSCYSPLKADILKLCCIPATTSFQKSNVFWPLFC